MEQLQTHCQSIGDDGTGKGEDLSEVYDQCTLYGGVGQGIA
jgi:hypothetical protein